MHTIRHIILSLLLLAGTSCVKERGWDMKYQPSDLIVVEGIITNEYKPHLIKLSRIYYELNGTPAVVTGAAVSIGFNDSSVVCSEDASHPGNYYSLPFKTERNIVYTLNISTGGKTYTAQANTVPVTPFTPMGYYYNKTSEQYEMRYDFTSQEPAILQVSIDWHSVAIDTADTLKSACLYYYALKTIDIYQFIYPHRESVGFPKGSTIIQRKYSLTNDHAKFIRSFLSETQWKGGYFDDYPANVVTNLSEGAVGFFGACEVLSDTLIVK